MTDSPKTLGGMVVGAIALDLLVALPVTLTRLFTTPAESLAVAFEAMVASLAGAATSPLAAPLVAMGVLLALCPLSKCVGAGAES